MSTSLAELADLIQGKLVGNGNIPISNAQPLSEAQEGHISFLEDAKYAAEAKASEASAIITKKELGDLEKPVIEVADPFLAFVAVVQHFRGADKPAFRGIDPRAAVHPTASFGEECSVAPFAVIGEGTKMGNRCSIHPSVAIGRNCEFGDDVVLYPGVVVYDNSQLGNRVIIHANSVIGADGYGYRMQDGQHVKIAQLGRVVVEDDVEIGAATMIDRATFQETRIGAGTKIDNLVQVAHNCQIGKRNLLVAQMGIAGSSSTGDDVVIAGQAGITDHVHIGEGTNIGAMSGVTKSIPPNQRWFGLPAREVKQAGFIYATMDKLPDIYRDLKALKKRLPEAKDAA